MSSCGTGLGNFPQPGDPSNNDVVLTAATAFGGVNVRWNYPGLNPHAVAHTKLYRNTSNDPVTKSLLSIVNSDHYFDTSVVTEATTYFYWIEVISINGTVGDLIGPASATANPLASDHLSILSGQILQSHLAQSLTTRIDDIDLVGIELNTETTNRSNGEELIMEEIQSLQSTVGDSNLNFQTAIATLQDKDSSIIESISTMSASIDDPVTGLTAIYGVVQNHETAIADGYGALAQDIETVEAAMNLKSRVYRQSSTPAVPEGGHSAGDLWIDLGYNDEPVTVKIWNGGGWLNAELTTGDQTTLEVAAQVQDNNVAMIGYCSLGTSYQTPAACTAAGGTWNAASPLAEAVKTVQISNPYYGVGSIEQVMSVHGDTTQSHASDLLSIGTDVNNILAEYTVKLDVNGYVAGFGITNSGTSSLALFNVDKFAVGKPGVSDTLPFIVDSTTNTVYLEKARIKSGDIDTLKVADNAITVPVAHKFSGVTGLSADNALKLVGSFSYNHGHTTSVPVLVDAATVLQVQSDTGADNQYTLQGIIYVYIGATLVLGIGQRFGRYSSGGYAHYWDCSPWVKNIFDIPPGTHTVSMYVLCTAETNVVYQASSPYLSLVAVKR
jgi:hypothetical protein